MKLYFAVLAVLTLGTVSYAAQGSETQQVRVCKRSAYVVCPTGPSGPSVRYCPPKARYSRNLAFQCAVNSGGAGGKARPW